MADIDQVKNYFQIMQKNLCAAIEKEDGRSTFGEDFWKQSDKGEGCTRVLNGGAVFEQGGIGFSHVYGNQLPAAATIKNPQLKHCRFEALGISLVFHPYNPYVPTTHANLRFFIAETSGASPVWWFGGGYDLTPYYGFVEDCEHWHRTAKKACDPFGVDIYPRLKKACDDYFYLPHRKEARGIGGLFFDDWNQGGFAASFDFVKSVGDSFLSAYLPIVQRRKDHPYGAREIDFQHYRRGRYVEFNLIYDRGTLFGLQLGGRVESILMSLPPTVSWRYNWAPSPGSEEARLYETFLLPQDWAAINKKERL